MYLFRKVNHSCKLPIAKSGFPNLFVQLVYHLSQGNKSRPCHPQATDKKGLQLLVLVLICEF